nr:hypothetical protein BGP89_05470 [Luteimonas sp. JM171]
MHIPVGAGVGDHHEALHAGLFRRLHGADRGLVIHGVGALRIAASGACRKHDGVRPIEGFGQRLDPRRLDVQHHRIGAGSADRVRLARIADDRVHRITGLPQLRRRQQRHLAVAADDHNAFLVAHASLPPGIRNLDARAWTA